MMNLQISSGRKVLGQVELPVPLEEFKRKVDELRSAGQPDTVLTVFGVDGPVPALSWHLQHTRLDSDTTLQKLNQLAETVECMGAAGRYQLTKSLDPELQQSLDDVLQIAAHIKPGSLDCYEVIPGVASDQELGKWLVEHDRLADKAPETLRPYLDYRSIGINYRNEHEGEFLADGYTGLRAGAVEQVLEEQSVMQVTLATLAGTFSLGLPATEDRLEQAKRALDVEDFAQASITAAKFSTPYLAGLLPRNAISVEDANELALCLQEMEQEDGELIKFCAILEVEQPETFAEARRIAVNLDDYEQVPEDMDEYGRQVLRRIGADEEVIDAIEGYMDFFQLGTDSMEEDGVRRTEFGLVCRLSQPFPPEPEIGQEML